MMRHAYLSLDAPRDDALAGSASHFILELLGTSSHPQVRTWARSMSVDSSETAPERVLIVSACTRCGWRTELAVPYPTPGERSSVGVAAVIAETKATGTLPLHRWCDTASPRRWRAPITRVPLRVARDVGAHIDVMAERALETAYDATRQQYRLDPGVSVDYLAVNERTGMTSTGLVVPSPPLVPGFSMHELIDELHFAVRRVLGRLATSGDSIAGAVVTLSGLTQQARTADVIVMTPNGAFRKRLGGLYDGYCRDWSAIAAPHDFVDGLLVHPDA